MREVEADRRYVLLQLRARSRRRAAFARTLRFGGATSSSLLVPG